MIITEIVQLSEIEDRAQKLQYGNDASFQDGIITDLKVLITSSFIEETKVIFLKRLDKIDFFDPYAKFDYQKKKAFDSDKNDLLSLIENVRTAVTQRPETLKRNQNSNTNVNISNWKQKVVVVIKEWVIPVLGLILGGVGSYGLYMANNIKNELKQELKVELKNEISLEMQQEVSQMVKQEVQQKVDNHIIINNNK